MARCGICLLTLLFSLPAAARPELKLKSLAVATTEHELSGIAKVGEDVLLVSDAEEDTYIYKVVPDDKKHFSLGTYLDLAKLSGFQDYLKSLQDIQEVKEKQRRFDLEGIAHCGKTFYLANERVREIVVIEDGKTIKRLPTNFRSEPNVMDGKANAGFEGVAVDCKRGHLYAAKERDPRILFRVDLKTGKILKTGDVEGSDRQGKTFMPPPKKEKKEKQGKKGKKKKKGKKGKKDKKQGPMLIGPDLADLFFDGDHLYLLERNTYEITKINPETFAVIARVSYADAEKNLYNTGEPFGIAEALLLTDKEIVVGFDNNGTELTKTAAEKYGVAGRGGALIYFERPAGF